MERSPSRPNFFWAKLLMVSSPKKENYQGTKDWNILHASLGKGQVSWLWRNIRWRCY